LKKYDRSLTGKEKIAKILPNINAMPMKYLGLHTPHEVLNRHVDVALTD